MIDDNPFAMFFNAGKNICIDGGITRNMIHHNDNGCRLEK